MRVFRYVTVCTLISIVVFGAARGEEPRTGTTTAMIGIYGALSTALDLGLDTAAFQDPGNHEQILLALRSLSAHADNLEAHAGEMAPNFEFLRRSLARDTRDAAQRFEEGQYIGARFVLTKLTENCVSCHSKLPGGDGSELGKQFVHDPRVEALPLDERARIEIAARQFNSAMDTYEEFFRSEAMTATGIALTGAFEEYLKIAICVEHDTKRPAKTFKEFSKRWDVPGFMKEQTDAWIESLGRLELDNAKGKALEKANELIESAGLQQRFPADRHGLVNFVAASCLIQTYLDGRPTDKTEMAQAYYLLGFVESYMSRSYWISETEYYLETSIRLDPKSPVADDAYDFLEQYITVGYTGSGSIEVPENIEANLRELRELIDAAK